MHLCTSQTLTSTPSTHHRLTRLRLPLLPSPLPSNSPAQLLQFHIVPTAALKSTELKDGQKAELKTLEGGSINVYAKDGKVKVCVNPAPGTEVPPHMLRAL